jgi:hypothetical protein
MHARQAKNMSLSTLGLNPNNQGRTSYTEYDHTYHLEIWKVHLFL